MPRKRSTFHTAYRYYCNLLSNKLPSDSIEDNDDLSVTLKKFRKSNTDTDVKLICKDGIVEAHRIILRARSPFFDSMFATNMKESKTNEVEFPNWHKNIVERVINKLYCAQNNQMDKDEGVLNEAELLEVIAFSHMILQQSLFKHFWAKLLRRVSSDNFVNVWNYAILYSKKESFDEILEFIIVSIYNILRKNSMVAMSEEQMDCYWAKIRINDISVKFVLQWALFDIENRRAKTTTTLLRLELRNFSRKFIQELLIWKDMDGIDPNREFRDKLTIYVFNRFVNGEKPSLNLKVINNKDFCFQSYDFVKKSWTLSEDSPDIIASGHCYVRLANEKDVFVFSNIDGHIQAARLGIHGFIAGPPAAKIHLKICAQDTYFYVLAGINCFARFNIISKMWQKLSSGNLNESLQIYLVANSWKILLICHITDGSTVVYEYMEQFDKWWLMTVYPHLLKPFSLTCSGFHCRGEMYFLEQGANCRQLVIYVQDEWNRVELPSKLDNTVAVCANCDEGILVFCTKSGPIQFWYYHPETNECKKIKPGYDHYVVTSKSYYSLYLK